MGSGADGGEYAGTAAGGHGGGRTDLGLMSSGQVAGLIGDLPSCAELIEAIMTEAGATLDRLEGMGKA